MKLGEFMTWKETVALTAIPRSSLYAKINADEFPKPKATGKRGVRFVRAEVEKWISDRKIAVKTGYEAKPGRPPVRGELRRRRKSLSKERPQRTEKPVRRASPSTDLMADFMRQYGSRVIKPALKPK